MTRTKPYFFVKRILDLLAVVATAPLWLSALALAAIAVRLSSGSPVFFTQSRAGFHGRPFTILKLRTMRDGPDPEELRITKIGRILRSSGLDELPQLFNVLKGEMSLVGPRPLLVQYLPLYTPEQARRLDVLPGITGLAQIRGRNAISWEEKLTFDTIYAANLSFWLDCRILAITLRQSLAAPFQRRPSLRDRIMPPFEGTTKC